MAKTAPSNKFAIDALTAKRLKSKKMHATQRNGITILEDFAIFIDTHRDQPHVGVFFDDIHRGMCRPVKVSYLVEDDSLMDPATGQILERHDKHMFVTIGFFSEFLMNWMMDKGSDPRDGDGCLPTSHFRNARPVLDAKGQVIGPPVYELKSFREIVRRRYLGM